MIDYEKKLHTKKKTIKTLLVINAVVKNIIIKIDRHHSDQTEIFRAKCNQ